MLVHIRMRYISNRLRKFCNSSDYNSYFTAANAQWMWSNTCDHRTRPRTRTSSRTRTRIRTRTRRTRSNNNNNITNHSESEVKWSNKAYKMPRFRNEEPGVAKYSDGDIVWVKIHNSEIWWPGEVTSSQDFRYVNSNRRPFAVVEFFNEKTLWVESERERERVLREFFFD